MTMHIGHVALRVTNLDRAIKHAQTALGLRVVDRTDEQALLSSNERHHELQLIAGDIAGLDHVGLEVDSAKEVAAVAARAAASGATALEAPAEPGFSGAVRFAGPADIVYEIYTGMARSPLTTTTFLRPGIRKFGHLTFFCEDHAAVLQFWVEVLGCRVSDEFDGITWTRCDADHHGLAVGPSDTGNLLHHYAWEVQDFPALGQYCDSLAEVGLSLFWGPVRHGPGANLAVYLPDPEGAVIEVYTDLLKIDSEAAYEPIDWSQVPNAINLWGPPPGEELLQAGVPIVGLNSVRGGVA